jgi:hypothetical protein
MPGGEGTLPALYRIAGFEVSTLRRALRCPMTYRNKLHGHAPCEP